MKNNGPVTQVEHPLREDDVLISKTDNSSYIAYANHRFVEISGFEYEELVGSPHNMVRHPDMPAPVFADMWSDLKAGQYWSG
jgi:aerotaxis receptor